MSDPEDALRALADAANGSERPVPATPKPPRPAEPSPTASHRPESPIAKHPPPAPKPKPPTPPQPARPEAPPTASSHDQSHAELDELSLASASALAELSGATSAAYDPAATSQARRRRPAKPDTGMMTVRTAAVPVLITVGLMMTALGVWGVLVKAGNTSLPMADRPNAGNYALLALVCLPIGLCLFAGAWFFLYQNKLDKRRLEAYERAQQAER